jgi:hypothetical protein
MSAAMAGAAEIAADAAKVRRSLRAIVYSPFTLKGVINDVSTNI